MAAGLAGRADSWWSTPSPEFKERHEFLRGGPASPVSPDGGGGGAVADQMHPWVLRDLRRQPSGHDDASSRLAQHERRQVIEGTAKAGAPEDHVGAERGPI